MNKNYELIQEVLIKDFDLAAKQYKHIKSGAKILILPCDDNNKTFAIGFRTTTTDDTGVPHIMEHSTLCGSKKYPVKDPFVELCKSSLNTYLNAVTYPDKTVYPIASCNEKDFKNLMDVYLNAVFYPNVYTHEEIFKQEGWHYELDSLDGELTINGVVCNEMQGVFSGVDNIVGRQSMHELFPNTTYRNESGGHPDSIPNLSYEDFKVFHKKFYSPSNSYIILYGNCDMEERLDYIDKEYLSKFDIVDVNSHIDYQPRFDKEHIKILEYPVSKESSVEDKTFYTYNVLTNKFNDYKEKIALRAIGYALIEISGAPLKQALLDSGLCMDVDGGYEDEMKESFFTITARNAKSDKLNEFKSMLYKEFNKVYEEGFDKDAIKGFLSRELFSYRENASSSTPQGLLFTFNILSTWLYDDLDIKSSLDLDDIYVELLSLVDTHYFEDILKQYIIDNNHVAYVVANPSYTIGEEKEQALKEKLKAYKDSLSTSELEKIIEDTKKLKEYQKTPSTADELSTLPRLHKEDIDDINYDFSIKKKYIDGIELLSKDFPTRGITYLRLYFRMNNMPLEELKRYPLLLLLLGFVDTSKHTYQELNKISNIELGSINILMDSNYIDSNRTDYYTRGSFKCLYGKESIGFDLLYEMMMESKFDNLTRIKELIQEKVSTFESTLPSSGHRTATKRALSYINRDAYINELMSGIAFYDYLKNLLDHYDELIQDELKIIKGMVNHIFSKKSLFAVCYGDNKDVEELIIKFRDKLSDYEYDEKDRFIFTPNILNEGLKTSGKVQYVARCGMYDTKLYNGCFDTFLNALRYDYLWNNIRVQGGAYGAMANVSPEGTCYFTSYRDPKLKETNDIYEHVIDYIDNFNPTDEELEQYIIGAIGAFDVPFTPLTFAPLCISLYLSNKDGSYYINRRNEIINSTVENIKKIKDIYKCVLDQNVICVVGNENKINDNSDLFKNIRPLLK